MLGQLKCLSYLGRGEDAIRVADTMLTLGTWYLGDAYYWRAWNRQRMQNFEGAWDDLQAAKRYLPMDGQVAKLTGLIALGRNDLARAEEEFQTAIRYNDTDSDARFYLGTALATAKKWKDSAESFAVAEGSYTRDQGALRDRISEIAASELDPVRKARLTSSKEKQILATRLQQARSAFSAAAGYFNVADFARALPLAERAREHPDLADSAAKLLDRMPKMP
jgi:predicted Zn-dependent protease